MQRIEVYKGRTNIVQVSFGFDVSDDDFVSEIRVEKDRESELIASWDISFASDGKDGELLFKIDDSVSTDIKKNVGYMDIKRISAGEPLNALDDVIEVLFKNTITV